MPILQMVTYPVEKRWKPWANTVLYLPMETDYQDHSSNWYVMSVNWSTITKESIGYYMYQTSLSPTKNWNQITEYWLIWWNLPYTISIRQKSVSWATSYSNAYSPIYNCTYWSNRAEAGSELRIGWNVAFYDAWNSWSGSSNQISVSDIQNWHLYTIVIEWTKATIYQDTTATNITWNYNLNNVGYFEIWKSYWDYNRNKWCYIWQTVVEKWWWSLDEIINYYNQTKWNYWL